MQLRRQVFQDGLQRQFHFVDVFGRRRSEVAGRATGFGWGVANCGMGTGGGGAACVTGRGGWGVSAPVSFSSKRRSSSRSNPANLVFTPFGIAHSFSRGLLIRRLANSQQEARHGRIENRLPNPQAAVWPRPGGRLSQRWTGCPQSDGGLLIRAARDSERQLLLSARLRLKRFVA